MTIPTIATAAFVPAATVAQADTVGGGIDGRLIRKEPRPPLDPDRLKALPPAVTGKDCIFYGHADGGGRKWRRTAGRLSESYPSRDVYAELAPAAAEWGEELRSSLRCDRGAEVYCPAFIYADHKNRTRPRQVYRGSPGLQNVQGWRGSHRAVHLSRILFSAT